MKCASILFIALAMMVGTLSAFAQDTSNESFYKTCIEKALVKYEHKAQKIASDRTAIKRDAAVATLKAAFIQSHKAQLLNQMCTENMEPKAAKVDYFLTTSFGDFMGENLNRAVAEIMKEDVTAKEVYEAYSEEKP